MLKDQAIEISNDLSYIEEHVPIVDHKVKQLRNCEIPIVKVIWKNHSIEEATWETEEKMRKEYPHLFGDIGKEF